MDTSVRNGVQYRIIYMIYIYNIYICMYVIIYVLTIHIYICMYLNVYIITFYNIHIYIYIYILIYIYVINIDEKYMYTVGLFQLVGLNAQLNCRYIHRRSNVHFHPMAIVVGQWRMLCHNDIMSHTPIIDLKKADNSCERWLVASSHLFCLNWNLLF